MSARAVWGIARASLIEGLRSRTLAVTSVLVLIAVVAAAFAPVCSTAS